MKERRDQALFANLLANHAAVQKAPRQSRGCGGTPVNLGGKTYRNWVGSDDRKAISFHDFAIELHRP